MIFGNGVFCGGPRVPLRRIRCPLRFGRLAAPVEAPVSTRAPFQFNRNGKGSRFYLVNVCLVGATVDVGAAFEMAKVSQTFQPSGRFSERNSL